MTNTRQFWDAIDANRALARRKAAEARADREMRAVAPTVDDSEMDCRECQGTGLADGPDGPPCEYCDGSGVW